MESPAAMNTSPGPARRILFVAAVILVVLFYYQARGMLWALVTRTAVVPAVTTGQLISGADGRGYYAWLRSPLIDGDFQFADEFAPLFAQNPGSGSMGPPTATGHTSNPWPIGPSLVWAPAVIVVHLILEGMGPYSPWPADGYSPPYQLAVAGTTLALAMLTLFLTYGICRSFAGATASAAAAALITLGTPFVCYATVEMSMAHAPASAALSLFVFVWLRTFGNKRPRRWVALGCLLGLVCLMRWQLATFAMLPALEALWLATRADAWPTRFGLMVKLAIAGSATLVVQIPQVAAKQIVYGHPVGGLLRVAKNWSEPSFWTVLASTDRGLFYWTPIAFAALAGLICLVVRTRHPALMIVTTAIAVHIYTIAALFGEEVFLGSSFGFRMLSEATILMAPGIALFFHPARRRTARWAAVGGGLLVAWNLLLLGVYRHYLGGSQGGSPAEVCAMAARYFILRPLEAIIILALVGWMMAIPFAALRNHRGNFAQPNAEQDADTCTRAIGRMAAIRHRVLTLLLFKGKNIRHSK